MSIYTLASDCSCCLSAIINHIINAKLFRIVTHLVFTRRYLGSFPFRCIIILFTFSWLVYLIAAFLALSLLITVLHGLEVVEVQFGDSLCGLRVVHESIPPQIVVINTSLMQIIGCLGEGAIEENASEDRQGCVASVVKELSPDATVPKNVPSDHVSENCHHAGELATV